MKKEVESGGKALPPHLALEFPSLSPTMTKGNLLNWEKKEGDEVKAGNKYIDSLHLISFTF